jgi:cyclic pyranopterin phosphate synthase
MGRAIRDLRVSLTDRCNFRCFYCLPHGEPPIAPKEQMLSYEEIEYVAEIFVSLGIEKIRLTGGEPMMRRDIETIIRKLSALKPALRDLALTTNGYFLPGRAAALKEAGLDRVTISLDSLRPETFRRMTGVDVLARVLEGIAATREAGLTPLKMNAVIVRGHNDTEVADFAAFAREHDIAMRFIEFMPLDSGHEWSREMVFSGREICAAIEARFPLVPVQFKRGAETSARYRFATARPARSASSRPSPNLSAARVRASASPPTARSGRASFPLSNTPCAMSSEAVRRAPRSSSTSNRS